MAIKKLVTKKVVTDEEKIKRSKLGKRSKNKGATYERKIAQLFKEHYNVELTRTPQSGGFAKKSTKAKDFRGDIACLDESIDFNLHVECKNQKSVSIRKWINQAEEDCPKGKIPLVIYYLGQIEGTDGKIKEAKKGDYVTLKLEDFMNLVNKEAFIEEVE